MRRSKLPPALRTLADRNFRLFLGSQLISVTGTYMQAVAQSWLIYRLTNSLVLLGFVGFSTQFPVFLFGPFAGAICERRSRQHILLWTQSSAMMLSFAMAVLTLAGRVQAWHILAFAGLLGLVNSFDLPARQALIADIVKNKRDLVNAIPLNSVTINCSRMAGSAVAGLLISAAGEGWCFFGNALSYLAAIAGLLLMTFEQHQTSVPNERSILKPIREGLNFIRSTGPVIALLMLLGLVSFWGMRYEVLLPVFADQVLHSDSRAYGLLVGASGAGAILSALSLVTNRQVRKLAQWIAFSTLTLGVGLFLLSLSRSLWLSAALSFSLVSLW